MSNSDLVERTSKLLIDTFAKLIPRDRPIGLIGFPETANCGDHATWLGEKRLLEKLGLDVRLSMFGSQLRARRDATGDRRTAPS